MLDGGELEVEVGHQLDVALTVGPSPCSPGSCRTSSSRSWRRRRETTERLGRIPPYLFAELERKIVAKKAAGVDVISLGIGDPTRPPPHASCRL